MSFYLYYPDQSTATVTVELPSPEFDNAESLLKGQVLARTRGGARRVINKGSDRGEAKFEFGYLKNSEKVALKSFFDESANGLKNSFQIRDHHGNLWNAWFLEAEIEFTNIGELTPPSADALWSTSFSLELEAAT